MVTLVMLTKLIQSYPPLGIATSRQGNLEGVADRNVKVSTSCPTVRVGLESVVHKGRERWYWTKDRGYPKFVAGWSFPYFVLSGFYLGGRGGRFEGLAFET